MAQEFLKARLKTRTVIVLEIFYYIGYKNILYIVYVIKFELYQCKICHRLQKGVKGVM